jgi:hypothetical protein
MSKPIERIQAKITRAKKHIQDFQLGARAFYDTDPYEVGTKEDPNTRQRVYYVTKADSVPDTLASIAADIIQNLRSPLDQIVYQLVVAAGGPKSEKVYYPIRDLAAHYPSARGAIAKYVRKEVIHAIDATEPYKDGKGHAIWRLNALNNPDKHQLLIGAGVFHVGIDFTPFFKDSMGDEATAVQALPPVIFHVANKVVPLNVGNELFREPIDLKVKNERRFTFDISLNAPGVIEIEPALKTFQDFANLIDGVVSTLGRYLP